MDKKYLIAGFVLDNYLSKGNFSFAMDEIAMNLGISKKTIYKHFSSRDEMLVYCIQGFFGELELEFSKLAECSFNTEQEFRKLIHDWFSIITDAAARFDMSALNRVRYRNPELWGIMNTNRERLIKTYFMKVLKNASDCNLIKKEIPIPLLVTTFINMISNLAVPEIIIRHGGVKVFSDFVVSLILDGILRKNNSEGGLK